jgi:hypothetical protein
MRTLALLAMLGCIAAAQTPTTPPAAATTPAPTFNTAELTSLNYTFKEMRVLAEQHGALVKQRDQIISEACLRVFKAPACHIDEKGALAKGHAPAPAPDEPPVVAKKEEPNK